MSSLAILLGLAFLVSVDVRIMAPVLPSIAASLGSTPGQIGLAMTTYSLAYGTGQLVYGSLSDRYGRIAVVRLAGLGFAICTVVSAIAASPGQFIGARLLAGACAGAVIPLTVVFIGDTFEYAARQVAIGRVSVVTSAGLAFSAAIGGAVAHFVSWRVLLVGYAALALIPVALMIGRDPARPKRGRDAPPARFADFLMNPRARRIYLAIFAEGVFLWGAVTYLGALVTHRHGLDQLRAGFVVALFGVGTMLGGLLLGPLQRFMSENVLAGAGGLVMAAALAALIPVWPAWVFAIAMFVLGLGFVALHTTLQLRGSEISVAARGKAFSLFAFSLFTGMAVGTAALGRLVDAGRESTLLAICAAGLVVVGWMTARSGGRRAA